MIVTRTFESDTERFSLLSDDSLFAFKLVAERADPVHRINGFVMSFVQVTIDSQSFVAAPGLEIFDTV